MSKKKTAPYGVAVFVLLSPYTHEVLVEEHPLTDTICPGMRLFPGGKIQKGEKPFEAMIREAREELGITVTRRQKIHLPRPIHTGEYGRMHPFLIRGWEGEIPNRVLDTGRVLSWVPLHKTLEAPYLSDMPMLVSTLHWITHFGSEPTS